MLLPTPPLPDTTPMTFLTLLLGLGASCWGAALREEHAAPQLEQSWVHSSLIVSLRTAVVPGVRFLLAFLDPIWQKTFRQIRYISYHKTGKETTHGPAHISQSNLHIYKEIHWGKGGGALCGRAI